MIGRHEALRTVFQTADRQPFQQVIPAAELGWELQQEQVAAGELPGAIEDAAGYAFDLAVEVPVRAWLFEGGLAALVSRCWWW